MICWAQGRRVAGLAVAGLLTISASSFNRSMAEEITKFDRARSACDSNKFKGFERLPTATRQVSAHFLAKPAASATEGEIREYLEYLQVFAKFASRQLFKASSGNCAFGSRTDATLNLSFELFSIGQNVHDECSLSRCVRKLSQFINSASISRNDFSATINDLVVGIRRSDLVDFKYPGLAARNATQEVYRHIYSSGTRERILADISASDFISIRFDDFSTWFKAQQAAFQNAQNYKKEPSGSSLSTNSMEDVLGAGTYDFEVRELIIDHHGWGHQSIILVNHAYEREGIPGIENPTLRSVCHPNSSDVPLDAEPWREMADRLACRREFMGRDRWLSLYSKKEPRATGVEMMRYAQAIVGLLKADEHTYPGLRVIVAKFSLGDIRRGAQREISMPMNTRKSRMEDYNNGVAGTCCFAREDGS
jgi:hypothetical protein